MPPRRPATVPRLTAVLRLAAVLSVLALGAIAPAAALGAGPHLARGAVSGTIVGLEPGEVTVQTHGRIEGVIDALAAGANAVTARDLPYVWGGGHGQAGVASTGDRGGPGANGRRVGFDCSGAVAAVLAAAGLWPPGSGVPNDAGVIAELRAEHLLAAGAGTGPSEVTLYDDPGVHIFMNIDGRFFGTSDGGGGGNRRGGAGWLDDGAPDAYDHHYKRYHLVPSVLHNETRYGHDDTFETSSDPALVLGAEPGESVTVTFAEARTGIMLARALSFRGATTVAGTVTALGLGTVTVTTPSGATLTFATTLVPTLVTGLEVGDGVQLSYTKDPSGLLVPHALTVTSTPAPPATLPGPPASPVPGGSGPAGEAARHGRRDPRTGLSTRSPLVCVTRGPERSLASRSEAGARCTRHRADSAP